MSTNKPNLTRVWASDAPAQNIVDPDITTPNKFAEGWLAEIPPYQHFNYLQQNFTQGLAHNNEQGINVWDADTIYPVNGICKGSDGSLYTALVEQSGNNPVGDLLGNWVSSISINDLSLPYVFDTVAAMQNSSIAFPVGKTIETNYHNLVSNDGGAKYIVRAGSSPEPVGSPNLNGDFYAELQGKSDWMSPEVFGSDGTAAVDSVVIPVYMKEVRKQLWKSGKTYVLDADVAGSSRAFEVFSDTEMSGYGAIVDMRGASNNGFYIGFNNGSLFRNQIRGFRFTQSNVSSITNAIMIEGFVNYMIIEDCTCIGMDQYFIGMGGDNSGYNYLTVRNNVATNINPQVDNQYSLCYEFFPKQSSLGMKFYGNYGEQVGWGGVFKIHTCTDSYIFDNTFIRTSNVGNSQSQAVMLGGRITHPTSKTHFHNNRIEDANSSLGALFIGNTSDNTYVKDNLIKGVGGNIWVGNGLTNSEISGNTVNNIFSLSPAQNDITSLIITGNSFSQLNFQAPSGGQLPDNINGLTITDNVVRTGIRIDVSTSSDDIVISDNEITNVNSTCLLYADNIEFKGNKISVSPSWDQGTQVIVANADNYRQMNNVWDLKGVVSQTAWLNGATGAQIVGETVEDALTRLVLDNGTNTETFDNRLKLSGGSWAVV
tara:strand:+ start:25 stop:1986 length:1962 start_codon:yes stop_codon:yes gene_type:complete